MALTLAQLIASGVAGPQTKRDLPQFDAVSIRPTPADDDKTLVQIFPDGISFHGAPIRMVLRTAFGIDDKHLIGSPAWTNATRYNIEAKVSPEDAQRFDKLKGAERNALLIAVLAERFNLKFHHETRELPIYALVIARGGPKLTRGAPDDPGRPKSPDPHKPEDLSKEHHWVLTIPGRIQADSITMYVLADQLTQLNAVGRPVVDKTGITGNYNFTLRWTADNLPFPILHEVGGLDAATAKDENTPSSLFTAIQEQLGLKLEPQKDHSDVTVIDHIDPPSPN